jgi:hypothetical protein
MEREILKKASIGSTRHYNTLTPIKRHSHTGDVSPIKYEEAYFLESGDI